VIEQKLDYLPFGAERVNVKADGFDTHFTYTDQEKDGESGLLYYGARYYDPVIGRFTQMDPVVMNATSVLANPQFLNSYAYSLNNPIRYIDPNGESPLEVMGGGIVGFVQGAWGTVKWGANAFVLNPIGTAGPTVAMLEGTGQGIRDFVADPIGEGNKRAIQIGSGVATAGGWYWNASDYERGVVLGGVAEKMTELYVGARLFSNSNIQKSSNPPPAPPVNRNLIEQASENIQNFLGQGTKVKTNQAGDKVFVSGDGLRKIHFDIKNPYPHENPHVDIEVLQGERWVKINQIYPKDVPKK